MELNQIIASDRGGGAERVALNIHQGFRASGYRSSVLVCEKFTDDPDIREVARRPVGPYQGLMVHCIRILEKGGRYKSVRGAGVVLKYFRQFAGRPANIAKVLLGRQNLVYPWRFKPDDRCGPQVFNFHNLHGGFIALEDVVSIAEMWPAVLTLHDQWLFTGHCAHPLSCDRWRSGCGSCPDLGLEPHVPMDSTRRNLREKVRLLRDSRLAIVSPSRFVLDRYKCSLLYRKDQLLRHIPNGVDTEIFRSKYKDMSGVKKGDNFNRFIVLFVGRGSRNSSYKYDDLVYRVAKKYSARWRKLGVAFATVGGSAHGEIEVWPRTSEPLEMARYFRRASLYMHAARMETFPNVILEAMATGLPVVASNVGGIPEQVRDLQRSHGDATGFICDNNEDEFAEAIARLAADQNLARRLGENGAKRVSEEFSLRTQVAAYLRLYEDVASIGCRSGRNGLI